ncbi:MAG: exopolysaccharide biosynthesis polyprenyl glycosylphosphotransferase [Sphingomicrobium sp.]
MSQALVGADQFKDRLPGRSADNRRAAPSAPVQWIAGSTKIASISMFVSDVAAIVIATIFVLIVRSYVFGPVPSPHFALWSAILAWFAYRALADLYSPFGLYPPVMLQRSFASALCGLGVQTALLLQLTDAPPWRLFNLLVWLVVLPLTYALRAMFREMQIKRGRYGCPIVVIGNGPPARRAIRELLAHPGLGYVPVGVFSTQFVEVADRQHFSGIPVIGRAEDAPKYEFPYPVSTAMLVVGDGWHDERNHQLGEQVAAKFPTLQLFSGISGHGHWLSRARPLGPYLVIETHHARFSTRQHFLKRLVDIAVSLPVLILAAPFVAIAALAIIISDPGPVFFSQLREGRNGKPIRIYKLRSMVVGAEAKLAAYLAKNELARFEYERTMKLRLDPRIIPRIGKFVRKSSLDEIPQLWSILKGDMSLVGPRVMPAREIALYSLEGQRLRRQVSPGLTGFWQVEHRSDSDFKIREVADTFYVSNWSIWLDVWIILRTVRVVLSGAGAF